MDLGKQYVSLNRTIYDESGQPRGRIADEQAAKVAKGSIEILHKGILLLLDSYNNDARAIRKGIDDIQGNSLVGDDPAGLGNVPFIDPFVTNGDDGAAVDYLDGNMPYLQPYLEFYTKSNGQWGLRASVGEEYRTHTFYIAKLPSPLTGQAWYLAWGAVIGDTGARLDLRLYAFDGTSVRTVWKRDGMVRGEVHVSGGQITLEHERAYQSHDPRVTETLYVTPNGLE